MLMLERHAMNIVLLVKFSPGEEVHKGNNMCINMDRCCKPKKVYTWHILVSCACLISDSHKSK